jgi:hypothetical protein
MHLFNPFFDNFAEAFRLVNFSNRYFFSVRTEVEAGLRCLLKEPANQIRPPSPLMRQPYGIP